MTTADRKSLQVLVTGALADLLGLTQAQIDPDERFSHYGLTSLSAAGLIARLSALLGRTLPPTLVWDYPSSSRLAAFLSGETSDVRMKAVSPMADDEPVAIIGLACRVPGAADPEAFWQMLVGGVEAVSEMPRKRFDVEALFDPDASVPGRMSTRRGGFLEQVDLFDAGFFGMSPREAVEVDPQQRLILELAWETLERAGIAPSQLHGSRTGVFMGAMWSDYGLLAGDIDQIAQHSATGRDTGIIANRVSYLLGLTGPSMTVNTACSSSLVAVHLACRSLRSGESTIAFAGGVNLILTPDSTVAMTKFGAMAPDGRSKAFDARANGYVRGEGAGIVLLKPLSRALADGDPILALVRGSAVNNDGPSNGLTAPSPDAQRAVLRDACDDANMDPGLIDYVEAHGTGTMLGDPIEAASLGLVLGQARDAARPLLVGSVKTNIGHLEAAAGITGMIKTVMALGHRSIPPSLHFESPNPHIDFERLNLSVVTANRPWPAAAHSPCAGVSSFGFGGTNAHVVLQAWEGGTPRRQPAGLVSASPRPLVFVYSGNGAQWAGMGRDLLGTEPAFRAALQVCDAAFKLLDVGFSVIDEIIAAPDEKRLADTVRAQVLMFSVQIGLTRLLQLRGFVPDAVAGHSLGEIAAAHAAGALSLSDAARIVLSRSRLQAQAAGSGAMAVIELPWAEATTSLSIYPSLVVAGANTPDSAIIAGPSGELAALLEKLAAQGVVAQRIRVDVAYHSPAMDALCAPLADALAGLVARPSRIPFYSTVDAAMRPGESLDAAYWVRNLRQPVRFAETLAAMPDGIFVEISPHPILSRSINSCLAKDGCAGPVAAVLSRDEAASKTIDRLLGTLLAEGVVAVPFAEGRSHHMLTLSARDPDALLELAGRYARALPDALADACFTASTGRDVFAHRLAVIAPDAASMRTLLAGHANSQVPQGVIRGEVQGGYKPDVTLHFGYAAPQLSGIDSLLASCTPFADSLHSLYPVFHARFGVSWPAWLAQSFISASSDKALQRALAVAIGYSFARLLQAWGIRVASFTGDGPGALTAEALAGNLPVAQAILDAANGADVGKNASSSALAQQKPGAINIIFGDVAFDLASVSGCQRLALRPGDAWPAVLDVMGRLFAAGVMVDWQAFYLGITRNRVLLPSYAFQRRRYWPKNARHAADTGAALYALEWQAHTKQPALPVPAALVDGLSKPLASDGLPAALDQLASAYAAAALGVTSGGVADSVFKKRQLAGLQRLAAAWQGEDAEALLRQLLQKHPSTHIELALVGNVGRNLAAVLDGRMSPIDLLFPEGSMDQLQALYEKSAFALTLAEWMRSAFAAVVAGLKSPRILEIGAGTGGTTAHLLPLLPPGGEYLFSDVSRAFLERAIERFGATPGFSTALVDIEAVQCGQDIASGNDLVIAVNVLHATRDLHATLSAVRSLLRPGGLLLLGEITGAPGWLDLVFGLLEGWWRFEDTSLRSETALLTPTQWRALLAETGFDDVAIAQDRDRQGLIIARAGPVPGRRLVLGSGVLARRLADALAERGMAAEQHDTLPPGGQWLETIVCDQDQTAAQACEALGPVFADSRFGRVSLVHLLPASPSSTSDLEQSARQAARQAFALSSGAANPSRWGGTLQIDDSTLSASPQVLSDFLQQGAPEDCLRVAAQGLEVARVKSISSPAAGGLPVHADRCYLITGGFGALGFAFARWLVKRGARHIALVGRHPPGAELQLSLDELRSKGVQILAFSADVTEHLAMSQVFADLDAQAPPLAGVVHAAGNAALDAGSALAAKLEGAKVLDLLTRDRPLDLFLLFSSAAGTWGAAGKEAYAAANAALDAFATWRRSVGLPALAVAWGRFSVRGLLSAHDDAALAEMGMQAMPPDQAFDLAWRLTTGPRACAVIADVDWARFREVCEARAERPLLRALPKASPALLQKNAVAEKALVQRPAPATAQALPAQGNLIDTVRQTVAEVLGHEDASVLSSTQGLFDLGLDSLLAVRLRSTLEARFGLSVPTAILFSYPTIGALADWLAASRSPEKTGVPAISARRGQAEADMAIAVIGIGCRFPGGVVDTASFEELLFSGVNAITEVPAQRWNWREWTPDASQDAGAASNRWGGFLDDVDRFDAAFFGISPKEAAFMDPQQRLLLETAWQAVEHAGMAPTSLAGRDVGVFVGITGSDYAALARRNRESGLEAQAIVGQPSNASAGRISFTLGLTGPAMAIDTACSSSLVAIHLACRALRAGDCSSALAGGVNLMLAPETSVILARAGMLSPNGQCRAFDAGADGFVRAEGCGMVLLKPLQQAIEDGDTVLAVVRGSAINHDGRASGFTVPNGSAQQAVLRAALHDARLSPSDVAYIEAHGTGTALGDPIEAHAMGAVFGGRAGGPLLVGSVKTNIGHAESAAGVAGFIKTVLALQCGRIPPTLHFQRLNPHISTAQALQVPSGVLPFPALDGRRIAGVSAFGASGTNAHLLLEAAAPLAPQAMAHQPSGPHLLMLSARHADSLRELGKSVGEQLDEHNLADIALSAAHARSSLAVRGFVLLESAGQGRAALAKMPVAIAADKPRLAFLFTGQGSQYAGMARVLYQSEAAFRAVWDRCDAIALPLLGESLTDLVFDAPSGEMLDQTRLAQPALFALGCALAALWREHGVEPDVVLGHSVGEFAAAVSAGILTLDAGMALVIERGRLMQALPAGGGMLAVRAGLDALHSFMAAEPELSLAAENGRAETVLSGPLAALQRLVARLSALDIPAQPLATSHAFHSILMEPMLGPLQLAAGAIEHSPARINFISNLDGAVRSSVEPAYWSQHAREPVRFAQGLSRAQALGCTVFVEIGPHAVLTALAGRVLDKAVLVPSMRRGSDERRTLLEAFGLAWQAGVAVRLPALQTRGRRVALPATPFRRVRHWLDWAAVDPVVGPANTAQAYDDCLYQIDWQSRPLVRACPDGVWLLAGAADESAAFAEACQMAGFNAVSHAEPPAGGWAGVLWFAPHLQNAQDAAAACAAFGQFVQNASAPVWLVTRAAQAAVADSGVDYHAAALWGLGRALAMQDIASFAGMMDLPGEVDAGHDAEALAAFLSAPGEDDQAALRGGQALLPRLERLAAFSLAPVALRADRTYLVSGGFGGLGLALVKHLVAEGARSIAVLGRHIPSELPAELTQTGLDIRSFAVDVASADTMKRVARQIESGMPPVAGIFHVAGIKSHDFADALHAKLGGAKVLHELSLSWPLELFVLFSSAAAVWGDRSLAAYAAANAALDGFAHWRRRQGLPALAINWGRFDVRGMLDDEGAALFERIGLQPISAPAAFRAMCQMAASALAQATVASVNWSRFVPIHRSRRARPLLERLAPPAVQARAQPPALQKTEPAPRSRAAMEKILLVMVSEILGTEDAASIDPSRGFFALGVDSFGIVDLRRRIEAELGIVLAPSALFDAPNITALAAALAPEAASVSETASPIRRQGENGFDPIAIVGTACRLPGGVADLDALERLLLDEVDAVGLAPAARLADWDAVPAAFRRGGFVDGIDLFDADFFGISPREAVQMDPQHRLLLELAWQALEHAGVSPPALRGSRTGVFVGITGIEYAEMARSSGQADAHAVGGQFLNAAAGRLSHALGLNGPSLAVDTACSSSAMALHLACNALWAGECNVAMAGGANLLLAPSTSQMLVQAKMLSPHGRCATFDAAADGYVRAEACALVVLKRLSQAQADGDRVLATILGTASNHDGASSGFTVPNGHAQQAVIRAALAAAQVTASDISYVEAHGTGTSLGDPIEMHALDAVFGEGRSKPLLVGSIKTNIGHAEAAAGVAGLLKLVIALRRSHIPAHLHFQSINPHIGVSPGRVAVAARAVHWEPIEGRRIAGLSAFGASGTNVHLILQQAPPAPASFNAPTNIVLALSARRVEDLGVLADQLMSTPDPIRAWREATLVRSSLPYRLCAVGNDAAQIREQIKAKLAAGHSTWVGKPQIAFLFTGQGAQYAGMAHGLYLSQPVFRAAIDRCGQAMRGLLPMSLTALLFEQTTPLVATELVQPALFSVGYGLAQLWLAWGVQPVAMLGHSVGEITAACIAGVLDLQAAASLVIERGRLMGALPPGGAMAAVMAPVASVTRALESGGGAVVVAARNGPANTVLSGESAALDRVLAELANEGIRTHRLAVSHAFHSPLLEPMLDRFEHFTAKLPMGQAGMALVSNRDGALRSQFDAAYWRAQAREPVAFADGMATLQTLGCDTFIEIGPQPVLCGMGRDYIEGCNWIASLRQGADDARSMLDAAASLWQAGAEISWKAVLPPSSGSSLALPPYPFRRTRHWLDAKKASPATVGKLFSSWAESPAFDGRMHSQTLERSSIAGLDDSAGLVHVGLHLAFLSSAWEAGLAGPAHAGVTVAGMQFVKPLVLAQPQQLQMLMNADGSASLHARQADRSWFCHMQAKIEAPFVAEVARLDVGLVRSACTEEVEASVFYAGLEQKGFHLGPGLRRITHLWRRGGEVLAQASGAVKHGDEDALAFGLPAALFENCAQLPAAAFPDQPHAYMLLGWDRMLRTAAMATDETWIHARATLADDGLTLHAEIGLYTADGDLLAAIEGAVFRRTQAAHLPNSKAALVWAGQLAWVESQPLQPGRPLSVGSPRWALLPTDEKTAVVAHALLAAHPHRFDVAGTSLLVLASGEAETEAAVLAQVVTALRSMAGPAVLLLVTQGNWQLCQAAGDANAAGAGVWGLAQVIRAERPDLICRCIDVSEGTNLEEALLAEMSYEGLENTVAWSGGRRFVARLATLQDVPAPDIKASDARRLVVEHSGSLDGLSWQGIDIPRAEDLKADEVLLQVAAAAPGMRDTLLVYGALPDGALGSDCSGTVLATGPGISAWRPGDAVIAYVPHGICALGTHVVLPASLVRSKPAGLGFPAAATLPVPYLTAWHGLVQVGGIKAGETVLVHSAGSAVGLAAVAIARSVGAHVVTSASLPKHAALRSMGLDVIGDSRTPEFSQKMAGQLDLAFGAFDAASSIAISGQMAPGGRVIDLTRLGHDGGIDLNRLLAEQPEQFSTLFDTVCAEIESGRLPPLPHEIVPPDEAVDALRRLSLGTVIGRLCISFRNAPVQDMRGSWLLTGANGGIGRMLAPHLALRGVTSMILLDRSPIDSELVSSLKARGIRVLTAVLDIADEAAMKDMFARAQQELPPISAIVHTAGVVADAALAELDQGHFARTFAPKVQGARLLDKLSRHLPIRVFTLFSSVVSHLPSARQGSYAAANAALEQVARRRRALGLPATAMSWGPWRLGIGDALGQRAQAAWSAWGVTPLSAQAGLAMFDRLCSEKSDTVILDVNWARYCAQAGAVPPLLEQIVPAMEKPGTSPKASPEKAAISMNSLADTELDAHLGCMVIAATARVLRAAEAAAIDVSRPFSEQGMDSLMATEFAEDLGRQLERRLPGTLIYNYPTPAAVTAHLLARIRSERVKEAPAAVEAAPETSPPAFVASDPPPQASAEAYERRLQASLSRMNKLLGDRS